MANEKRLIDANALCRYFAERFMFLKNASETRLSNGMVRIDKEIQTGAIIAKEFLDKANNAPTVDAVEVVRCKDCKHYLLPRGFCDHDRHDYQTMAVPQEDNDFCSYGERRIENEAD